jgi:hypothetical protein
MKEMLKKENAIDEKNSRIFKEEVLTNGRTTQTKL